MRGVLASINRDHVIVTVIVCVASVLILSNLGNQYLWQDEAETALMAKTTLAHGLPLGTDGRNSFSQAGRLEFGKNHIAKSHPWFQYYLLAGFYALFGIGTFTSRLPFALFGIATVVLVYYLAKELWGTRRSAVFAAALILVWIPFMLLVRQCRYYSPSMFFSMLVLYAYLRLVGGRKHAGILYVAATALLFHTQFVGYAASIMAVLCHASIFHMKVFLRLLLLTAIGLIFILPWMLVVYGPVGFFTQRNAYSTGTGQDPALALRMYGQLITDYIFPPLLLLLPVAVYLFVLARRRQFARPNLGPWRNVVLLLLFSVLNLLLLMAPPLPVPQFRYLAPLIPVSCVLMALILECAANAHIVPALIVYGLLASSQPIGDYVFELTHDYDGPEEGIVKYLNAHGSKNDIVAITYGDLPIKFYTGMRVIGGLTGEDLSPITKARWVILRKNVVSTTDEAVGRYFQRHLNDADFQSITLPYTDTTWENREDPEEHYYATVTGGDPVVIFERIRRP